MNPLTPAYALEVAEQYRAERLRAAELHRLSSFFRSGQTLSPPNPSGSIGVVAKLVSRAASIFW